MIVYKELRMKTNFRTFADIFKWAETQPAYWEEMRILAMDRKKWLTKQKKTCKIKST